MREIEITAIGKGSGVLLPDEVLARLRVQPGDRLYAIETPNGVELVPGSSDFVAQLEMANQIMRDDRDVLAKLAK